MSKDIFIPFPMIMGVIEFHDELASFVLMAMLPAFKVTKKYARVGATLAKVIGLNDQIRELPVLHGVASRELEVTPAKEYHISRFRDTRITQSHYSTRLPMGQSSCTYCTQRHDIRFKHDDLHSP